MSYLDKRGVSPIIGYVLLVVLALSLAGGVYTYLSKYAPDDSETCNQDVTLSIAQASCENGVVNVKLVNRGLFNADGAFIRVGNRGESGKVEITCAEVGVGGNPTCSRYFISYGGQTSYPDGLKPGESIDYSLSYSEIGEKEIEIQPLVFSSGTPTRDLLCKSIVKKSVECI